MRLVIPILLVALCFVAHGQDLKNKIHEVDTLSLGVFEFKKVLRYSFENATICINAEAYINDIKQLHKRYKSKVLRAEKNDAMLPSYEKKLQFIDSLLSSLKTQIRKIDTINLSHQKFIKVELRSPTDFDEYIDRNDCAVYNKEGVRQFRIIRQKASYHCGPLCGWGGRLYFLLYQDDYFLKATDWVS
ncbi:MAG: hypothetical protein RLO81_00790 [Fulvivirga sp.]|uniref:hypothetical protein n=1 Tax=Fulvivirga sp. TaxID=1931237 RepID=UPI0032EF030B